MHHFKKSIQIIQVYDCFKIWINQFHSFILFIFCAVLCFDTVRWCSEYVLIHSESVEQPLSVSAAYAVPFCLELL